MRHRKAGRALGRDSGQRKALFKNLVLSLLSHERIETTEAKAKEVRTFADQMITLSKRGDIASRRRALSFLGNKEVVGKLFSDIGPRFTGRAGGYSRIIKTRVRPGDGSPLVLLELTERPPEKKERKKKEGKKEEKRKAKEKAAARPE